jgi:hypothetical protein
MDETNSINCCWFIVILVAHTQLICSLFVYTTIIITSEINIDFDFLIDVISIKKSLYEHRIT